MARPAMARYGVVNGPFTRYYGFMWYRSQCLYMALGTIVAFAATSQASAQAAAGPTRSGTQTAITVEPPLFPALSYADLADMTLRAPLVAGAQIVTASRLKGELAPGLSAGFARFLINANVQLLLHGADGLSGTVSFIVDVPADSRGKVPDLRKKRFLLLADRVANRPQEIRLLSPRAMLDWTPGDESRLRTILTSASGPEAPPRITGVARAFHVPGAIPGESETQIFLTTADARPVSLNVLRRPGETPRWAVALAEIVDDAAAPPERDTLLWYRLACFLPAQLPDAAVAEMAPDDATAARND
ncbi:MAG: hypothetical protein JWR77_1836 [Rhizorhabdus sp.]|nr:hypothetical protein [Rhizorhabdus sp.]